MIKNTYLLFLLLLFGITGVMAQTVQIENVVKAPGDITVKVDMLGFTGSNGALQSIQLQIAFDDDLLYFKGISDVNSNFPGWVVPTNGSTSPVTLTYTSLTGHDIDTKIFDLNFGYAGGFNDDISFVTDGCEIVGGGVMFPMTNVTYINGSVTQTASTATVNAGPTQQASVTSNVLVPINMQGSGLTAVNALTFKIGYDADKLTFVQLSNSVLGGMLAANASNGVVTVSWNGSMNIAGLADPNVFDLMFIYNGGGDAPITFKPGCQIVTSSLGLVPTTYTDGLISPEPGTSTLSLPILYAGIDTTFNTIQHVPVTLNYTGSGYIGSVNLKIAYDNSLLIYKGFTYGTITSGIVAYASNGEITLVWDNINNTASLNGALLYLKFTCVANGTSPLTFQPGTTVTQTNLSNVILTYNNGSITVCSASINSQPVDATVNLGGTANFNVGVTNPCGLQWQVSTDGGANFTDLANDMHYSGVTTANLQIANVPAAFNGHKYRCFYGLGYSNAATLTVYSLQVNVKAIIQGPYKTATGLMTTSLSTKAYFPLSQPYNISPWNYNGTETVSTVPANVVDWVLVELRTGTAASTIVGKKAGFILADGNIVGTDGINRIVFPGLDLGNYYIVIRHRNHLAIMSATAQPLSSTSVQYDFTTAVSQAYGSVPMITASDGKAIMIGGDVNSNGTARATGTALVNDKIMLITFCGTSTFNQYLTYDVNLDGLARANGPASVNDVTYIDLFLGTTTYTCKVPN